MASYRVRQRRVKKREWAGLIADYRSSGLSAKKWCAANHVDYDQLKYRLYPSSVEPAAQPTRWLPVEISAPAPMVYDEALLIRVGEACIEVKPGFDPALLKDVVRVLSSC